MLFRSREQKALIIYDPNFRKPHLKKLPSLLPLILENISLADIVRGSDEDFQFIFGTDNTVETYKSIRKAGCRNLVCTRNKNGVDCHADDTQFSFQVPAIVPKSTIGAGDAFNAGIIFALLSNNIYSADLPGIPVEKWEEIVKSGIRFATGVCLSIENYVSVD